VYSVVTQRRAAIDGLEAKAQAITQLLVDVVGPSVALDDPKAVDDGLGYIADDADFEFDLVIGPDGKLLAYRGAEPERAARAAAASMVAQPTLEHRDGALVASYPVVTGGKAIATIQVGVRTSNAESQAGTRTLRAALISAIGIAVAVLVVLALAGRISRRNREMKTLLDNMEQGFVSMNRDGVLAAERSALATRLLGGFAPGTHLWEALGKLDPGAGTWLEVAWMSVRDGFMPLDVCFDQMPRALSVSDRTYRIEYKPAIHGGVLGDTLVVITDVTAEVARDRAEAAEHELLAMIERIAKDRSTGGECVDEIDRLVKRVVVAIGQPVTAELKRDLHTLKGSAAILGLSQTAERCHELEERIDADGALDVAAVEGLARSWDELRGKLDAVFGEQCAAKSVDVSADDLAKLYEALARGTPHTAIKQLVRAWELERTRPRLEHFAAHARALAQRLGKGELEVTVNDHDVRLDAEAFRPFWSAMSHVVRNAVDHGIEPPEERAAAGKHPCGRLALTTRRDGGGLIVEVVDDGHGIDWAAVAAKATAAGKASQTHDDLVDAMFSDGVTTRDVATEISGRGIGLAAMRDACVRLGGSIEVTSERGKGTTFRFGFHVRERAATLSTRSAASA
jgi:two-component system chemotaxis sensor kinase CheA